jgi:hypothetical protein
MEINWDQAACITHYLDFKKKVTDRKDKVQMNSEDRFIVNKINKRKKRD